MVSIADNLQAVNARIGAAEQACGRIPGGVRLLAVSKTWPLEAVLAAQRCGQIAFGENYVQELVGKVDALIAADRADGSDCGSSSTRAASLEWHFIGPLQSNKTRAVAERAAWVHTVDRLKLAERLAAQRPAQMPPLNVCVQVNVSGEASKSGCRPEKAAALCTAVAALPRLTMRGLMCIPAPSDDAAAQRAAFRSLAELMAALRREGLALDTLSMGMSHDLESAIAEGATMVRVGTAIFGERPLKKD